MIQIFFLSLIMARLHMNSVWQGAPISCLRKYRVIKCLKRTYIICVPHTHVQYMCSWRLLYSHIQIGLFRTVLCRAMRRRAIVVISLSSLSVDYSIKMVLKLIEVHQCCHCTCTMNVYPHSVCICIICKCMYGNTNCAFCLQNIIWLNEETKINENYNCNW